jgi:hypothetical protein
MLSIHLLDLGLALPLSLRPSVSWRSTVVSKRLNVEKECLSRNDGRKVVLILTEKHLLDLAKINGQLKPHFRQHRHPLTVDIIILFLVPGLRSCSIYLLLYSRLQAWWPHYVIVSDQTLLLRFRPCLNASVLENSGRQNVWERVAKGLVMLYWLIFSSPACVVIAALRNYVYFDIDLIEGTFA